MNSEEKSERWENVELRETRPWETKLTKASKSSLTMSARYETVTQQQRICSWCIVPRCKINASQDWFYRSVLLQQRNKLCVWNSCSNTSVVPIRSANQSNDKLWKRSMQNLLNTKIQPDSRVSVTFGTEKILTQKNRRITKRTIFSVRFNKDNIRDVVVGRRNHKA